MEHLMEHINGIDMALCLALLLLYVWREPCDENAEPLDTKPAD